MTLTIHVPVELEQRLEAEAKRQGLSKDDFVRLVLEERLKLEQENLLKPRVLAKDLPVKDRSREDEWLAKHRDEYAGQWVALDGDRLLAHSVNLQEVARTARELGVPDALMVRVESSDALPFAGF